MKTSHKILIGLVIAVTLIVLAVVAVGYVGLAKIPFITPYPQAYPNGVDLTDSAFTLYSLLLQFSGNEQMPTLDEIQGAGLDIHIYGTDDSMNDVIAHYDSQMATWELMHSDSGTGWSTKIWRHIAYGFALMVGEHLQMKALTGYNTIYMTIDGPMQSWMQIIDEFN